MEIFTYNIRITKKTACFYKKNTNILSNTKINKKSIKKTLIPIFFHKTMHKN